MAADPPGFLVEQHRRLGPIFRLRAGPMKRVVMAGADANAFAHGDGADCFSSRETGAPAGSGFIEETGAAAHEHPELFAEGERVSAGLLPFFAGVDTVGQTQVFILYELLRRPELRDRVTREVDALFADGPPDARALREAPDLNGAVTEALRLHPVAFAMPRSAARDFVFAGARVERGERVMVFTAACHFDPAYFPDPQRFDIDRHRPPRDEHRRPEVFAPWGRGPHQCLGAWLAGVQMAATTATILRHCRLELAEPDRTFAHVLAPSLSLGPRFRIRFEGWRHAPQGALRARPAA